MQNILANIIKPPPANKIWRIYRNHIVRTSVQLYLVHIFHMEKRWKFLLNKNCLWPEDVSWFWPNVIWASSRSITVRKSAKLVSSLYLSYGETLVLTSQRHTEIAYDPTVCHEFVLKSFGQIKGHWKKKFIICVCFLSFIYM